MIPPLPEWLRWLAELPAVMRSPPEGIGDGRTRVRAVVADLFESLLGVAPAGPWLDAFDAGSAAPSERNRLSWVLATCHVLWHPSLRAEKLPRAAIERLLVQEISALAAVAPAEALLRDEERREELVRRVLRAAGQRLPGETERERTDRLKQVDAIERHRVLVAAAQRERRTREVREAMARKAAEEAAAKVSRE